jgi:glucose-1-phosphatase
MIEVIFFDLGNVILPFNHFQIAEKLSRFSRKKEWQDPSRIFSYLFDFESGAVNRFDTGHVSAAQFFRYVREDLGLSLSFEDFTPIWTDIFTENEEVTEIVGSLKGRCRLGLLSNTDPLHFQFVLLRFPVLSAFDKWILSYEVGAKKPDLRIYQKAMEWASVRPEEILFIDDLEKNVEAARSVGMQGIHFRSASQMKEELSLRFHFSGVGRVPPFPL